MSKKLVLHVALASMILSVGAPLSAVDPGQESAGFRLLRPIPHKVLAPIFAALAVSIYALSYQHPVTNPKTAGDVKGIADAKQLTSDPKAYFKNLNDVFWTQWVGQPFKDKGLKVNATTGLVKFSKLKPPMGVMGWLNTYYYTGVKATKLLGGLGGLYIFVTRPDLITQMLEKYMFKKKDKGNGLSTSQQIRLHLKNGARIEDIFEVYKLKNIDVMKAELETAAKAKAKAKANARGYQPIG